MNEAQNARLDDTATPPLIPRRKMQVAQNRKRLAQSQTRIVVEDDVLDLIATRDERNPVEVIASRRELAPSTVAHVIMRLAVQRHREAATIRLYARTAADMALRGANPMQLRTVLRDGLHAADKCGAAIWAVDEEAACA